MPGIGNSIGTQQPPLHKELSTLSSEIENLDKSVAELHSHLEALMLPESPLPTCSDTKPRERQSDVVERIIELGLRVRCARMKLQTYISRIES